MSLSLVLACLWVVVAAVLAMLPSRDNLWMRAYILMAAGVPLLGYVIYENGILVGLIVLTAGLSVLRWPVIYLWRRIRGRK